MKSKPTDFWDKFSEELKKSGERKPEGAGWKTVYELKPRFPNLSHRLLVKHLNEGRRKGVVEYFSGIEFKGGKLKRTTWYRPAK